MGYTKEQLISRLQELKIDFSKYEHPVVMTVEAQAKFVGHLQGALSKNLFLKDKKHRYYVVSALAETKVDLKVLSQRLGLGKGGLRMAPEEALGEILQVPLGSVTPLALVNESARNVSLLLDQGFKTQESCFFHPLSNDMTISLKARDLDKFLNSIGKEPAYVDLEANPSVGKDQPPDLASLVPADVTVVPSEKITLPTTQKPEAPTDKTIKPSSNLTKQKPTSVAKVSSLYTDPEKFVEEMLEKATSIVLSEIKEENVKLYGNELGAVVSNKIKKQLSTELKNMAMIFKNTAYTEGFHAGSYCQLKRV